MSERFQVERLPEVDQQFIKRGLCPWCLIRLYEEMGKDKCPECDDEFVGTLTIED